VGVPLLRRNIKPVKDFQRLLDIGLVCNALRKPWCGLSQDILGFIFGVFDHSQPFADGGLTTANYVCDLDLGLLGFVKLTDESDIITVEASEVWYRFCSAWRNWSAIASAWA
jgi:hypothetical protein